MSEAFSIPPESDTARVPPRVAPSGPLRQPQPPTQPPEAPEKVLAKPLEELPKLETHRIFPLSVGVKQMDGTVLSSVKIKAPNGLDLLEVGGPPTKTVWTTNGMVIEQDSEKLRKWLGRLSEVDVPTLYRCHARDIRAMYEWLNSELAPAGN